MEDGGRNVAGQLGQFRVGLELCAGFVFQGLVFLQCRLGHDGARQAQRVGGNFSVRLGAQVVGCNRRRLLKLRAADVHRAAAGRVEVAHTGRDGIKVVQWLAKRIQAEWLHVVFQVCVGLFRIAAGKRSKLAGCHAHGPGSLKRIFQTDFGLAPQGVGLGVERRGIADLEDGAYLKMVLQVLANAWQVLLNAHTQCLQAAARSEA